MEAALPGAAVDEAAAPLTDDSGWRVELALDPVVRVLDVGDAVVDRRLSVPVACEVGGSS